MKKKRIFIIVIAILILAAGFGIYRLATYNTANHADWMSGSTLTEINRAASGKAITSGVIGTDEILLLHTLTKTSGQDSVAVFYIYQLPAEADGESYMALRADEAKQDGALLYMGSLTCRLVENDQTSVYDMEATYVR